LLIESYREAEISRVEIEKENMRRARENEAIFSKQQHHLEDLLRQQKVKLKEARDDLGDFQRLVAVEKQKHRKNVEVEVDCLMKLRGEHLSCHDWSEHELRKKKFKLKVKIEEYWKRMDLYETLLLELEIEKNIVKQETDEKMQDKIKQYEQQQEHELNDIREQIAVSKHDLQTLNLQLEEERSRVVTLNDELNSTQNECDRKIGDAEKFCLDVKTQESEMLGQCEKDIEKVSRLIQEEKDKLHHYTIYKMHECAENGGKCCNDSKEESVDCKIAEEQQRTTLNELSAQKEDLNVEYKKKVDKYAAMLANAQDALADLRQDKITAFDNCEKNVEDRERVISHLEGNIKEESARCKNLETELKAHERPRSFISAFPEESEEDIIANEQQIEQLLHSKEKVRKVLEAALTEEFKELKQHETVNVSDSAGNKMEDASSIDKALSLVFHAGNSSAYIDSMIKKNNQFEQRRRSLTNIRSELQDLMKYQMSLHREVAENFLTQKSLFEEVRSQERKDIHDTIQTMILDNAGYEDDQMLSHIFKESERIIEHQKRLDELENQ